MNRMYSRRLFEMKLHIRSYDLSRVIAKGGQADLRKKLAFQIRRAGDTRNCLMMLSTNGRATFRAANQFHRHSALSNSERMAVGTFIPENWGVSYFLINSILGSE